MAVLSWKIRAPPEISLSKPGLFRTASAGAKRTIRMRHPAEDAFLSMKRWRGMAALHAKTAAALVR